jgi:hypothetical protein
VLLDLTQVPSRVTARFALPVTMQLPVPLAHLAYLARHLRSAHRLALRVLLALTQVPSRVTAYSALPVTMQLLVPRHAHLVRLVRYL